jgi:uncharacterized protein YecE (DUF72 family)
VPKQRTADFVYLRGHGPSGRYEGRHSRATLTAWRKSIQVWQRSHCDVYVYFDNDQKSAAPRPLAPIAQSSIRRILETGNDSFRFKKSFGKPTKPTKEKARNLTNP